MHHKSHLRSPVLSRREWMALMASARGLAQGVATRGIPPAPRAKPSGIPFHAYFTDIAAQAGLSARSSCVITCILHARNPAACC